MHTQKIYKLALIKSYLLFEIAYVKKSSPFQSIKSNVYVKLSKGHCYSL